jgi:DNA recombination protein RmuC
VPAMTTSWLFFSVNIVLLLGVCLFVWFMIRTDARRARESESDHLESLRKEVQGSLHATSDSLRNEIRHFQTQFTEQMTNHSQVVHKTNVHLNERLDKAAQVVGDVYRELGKMTNVARSIDDLQNILKAPKLRGGFGELFLNDLLAQILPHEHFGLQYRFKNSEAVDAVIYLGEKMVPIDSKFPLENFQKIVANTEDEVPKQLRRQFINDIKKHIQGVAKYIRTDEGTYDFALMYIPAENVYYEVTVKEEIGGEGREVLNYALKHKVIPVSPNTLYAYLMTIIVGLKGMQIEKHASKMLEKMGRVQKDFRNFESVFSKLGTHLVNARKSYEDADKRLGKVGGKLEEFGTSSFAAPEIAAPEAAQIEEENSAKIQ